MTPVEVDLGGRTCLVTGGSSGIGKQAAVGLAQRKANVAIIARDPVRGEAAVNEIRSRSGNPNVQLFLADLSSQEEIRRVAKEVLQRLPKIHVLVNNAGATFGKRLLTRDGLEMTFALNHLAYFLLTQLLLERLKSSAPARIVNVASDAHRYGRIDFDDLQKEKGYNGWWAYAQSKLANILFTYELARRLSGTGVTANCLHPGLIGSGFGQGGQPLIRWFYRLSAVFLKDSAQGAKGIIHLAASPEVEGVTGKYFDGIRVKRSSRRANDPEAAKRLWELSLRLAPH